MYEDFFADRIAFLRMQKNVSAREMSLAIGQNCSYINRIENKLAFPSMAAFLNIWILHQKIFLTRMLQTRL